MQKINLRELYPDVYKTDVFVDVAEEVVAAIRGQEQDDAAYERRKFRHKAHYSLNREDGIENDALNRPLTPEEVLEQKLLREEVYAALMQLTAIQARRIYARFYLGMTVAEIARIWQPEGTKGKAAAYRWQLAHLQADRDSSGNLKINSRLCKKRAEPQKKDSSPLFRSLEHALEKRGSDLRVPAASILFPYALFVSFVPALLSVP